MNTVQILIEEALTHLKNKNWEDPNPVTAYRVRTLLEVALEHISKKGGLTHE